MQKLFQNFDAIFLINLPERKDRLAATVREFEKIDYPIAHPHNRVRIIPGTKFLSADGFPSIGMRGSFTSHLSAIQSAQALKLRNVLVCEDDIRFNSVDESTIDRLSSSMPPEWDIIYFGYLEPKEENRAIGFLPYAKGTIGGHFYAVNGPFFEVLANYMLACRDRPPGHPLGGKMGRDGTFNQLLIVRPDTKVFLTSPNLAGQRSSRSDITPSRLDKIVFPSLMSFARSLRHRLKR
ncbi:hypothetical protein G8O24_32970 [Bradyrhizobium sp. INPA01-394B]|uniref:Glycosyltransferase family 25 protein n=1 Tax=Bradyrhizobium campsiandrae TaxID=1729892 RepID=A0ABR7UBP5_9BRAD|nr:hypothetical protein [Bradyrhizobium campsiandrae]MBC9882146.1 hypothetical protein [Bradyrhizobium campsiandrae]MBC9981030.1 hypothetical protein [Bradyrhizobium campsiandrae]